MGRQAPGGAGACLRGLGSAGDPAVTVVVPGQVAVVASGEDDAFAVTRLARLVAVQVDRGGRGEGVPAHVAFADDGQIGRGELDERPGAVGVGAGDGEPAEPVQGDQVAPGELGGELDRLAGGVVAAGYAGCLVRSGGMTCEGTMTSGVSGSWRTTSTVTSWDHLRLRMTRASRA